MKALKLITILAILFVGNTLAQQRMGGKVVDVLDGKTMVIEMPSGRVTAIVHYIEIPEPDQQLRDTVKEHLKNLVMGKTVAFEARGFVSGKTLGSVYLNGVDVGQQMVRDGAAWHTPATRTGQSEEDNASYENYQALARTEKRGVWSIKDMKPAWEFRADKEERERREEEEAWQKASISGRSASASAASSSANKKGVNNVGALISNYDTATKTGSLRTPVLPVSEPENGSRSVCSVAYTYQEDGKKGRSGQFSLFLASRSEKPRFRSATIIINVDGKNIATGTAKRTQKIVGDLVEETLSYTVSRSVIEKIVNGSEATLHVGSYGLVFLPTSQMLLFNLLDASK